MLFPHGLELLPLIGRERLPNIEEHVRIGLFEVGTGLCDSVNLGKDLRLRSISFSRCCRKMSSIWCFC
jgi:hypothetical protein